jgi:Tol biopolymer transport system component
MKFLYSIMLTLFSFAGLAQGGPAGLFKDHGDIGHPKHAGDTRYDEATQTYHLKGSGYNIWFNRDEFQYAYRKIKGDFILTGDFAFEGDKGNPHRKIGWMIRESLDEDAAMTAAVAHGEGLTVLQWRVLKGAFMRDPEDEIFCPKKSFVTIQIERRGKRLVMRAAHIGEPLQVVGSREVPEMKDSVWAGLFICSHDPDAVEEARAWNVRLDLPVPDDYDPYKGGPLGCRLEILDIADNARRVIYQSSGRFEAPNWMPDGKRILFNGGGLLYTIPAEGGEPQKLNTGSAIHNNNDHGISFDGKMLAISNHREGLPGGGSTVYTLPLSGGEPKQITEGTPSYFHGWDPGGKDIAIVAQRNGSAVYNLYRVSLKDNKETALTNNTSGHVDGPEFSPDGKYIYYNANASGTMQIWRMRPDGSGKEQLTFDEYHNWFPHISPDGKWIVFISFPGDIVPPEGHPFCKRVMLRLMPVSGGAPRVIASLYGGQGTLNGPCWSPDSRHIAFVSNYGRWDQK